MEKKPTIIGFIPKKAETKTKKKSETKTDEPVENSAEE